MSMFLSVSAVRSLLVNCNHSSRSILKPNTICKFFGFVSVMQMDNVKGKDELKVDLSILSDKQILQ